jgi:hypothetical protein
MWCGWVLNAALAALLVSTIDSTYQGSQKGPQDNGKSAAELMVTGSVGLYDGVAVTVFLGSPKYGGLRHS